MASAFHFCGHVGDDDIEVHYRGEIGHIMAELKPSALMRLFGLPGNELHGLSVDVRDLLPRRAVDRMLDRVGRARNRDERIAAFSMMLLEQASMHPVRGRMIDFVAAEIDRQRGQIRMSDLSEQFDMSRRTLTRRFTEIVGLSPKRFANVARLNNTIRQLSAARFSTLADLAVETGYYDEAHMSHDFTRYFGMSPARFLEARNAMILSYAGGK
ncbi:helix-turn-helix domain-containing protein [Marimonas sp. MJW-29]|uniref:Helix-turn-helix domain-containing protein n=1 Tax=Sulfitobacter sediminis TaxID=3234186 RepID=A0ABV3RNA4_9RHOB